jgi:hypothetical protein
MHVPIVVPIGQYLRNIFYRMTLKNYLLQSAFWTRRRRLEDCRQMSRKDYNRIETSVNCCAHRTWNRRVTGPLEPLSAKPFFTVDRGERPHGKGKRARQRGLR